MSGKLELALLGRLEIVQDGMRVTGFSSSKAQALLCYLAVTGRPHFRPVLADLLWGDMPDVKAQTNLRKVLANLRRLVGSHLSITRQAVAFNREAPYRLDVEVFEADARQTGTEASIEALERAVELYRGDFLEGFYVRNAPVFEEWALAEQARLRELALQALHAMAIYHARRGKGGRAAAIDYTTRLLAMEPWREEAHRQLMLLLAQSGQRGAALAQYETCRQALAEELGVEPGAETTALYERIRDEDLRSSTGKPQGVKEKASFAPLFPSRPTFLGESEEESIETDGPVFVTRERELAQLDGFLDLALAGQGRAVFVTGGPGRGKTALMGQFARQALEAHPDLLLARGNCYAYSGVGDPYLPFREVMGMLTGDVEILWAAGAIPRLHAQRLWAALPLAVHALLSHGPYLINTLLPGPALLSRATAGADDDPDWPGELRGWVERDTAGQSDLQQSAIFEQFTSVLRALAQTHPLLLTLDDLQWADAASIGLLFHLGRRLADVGGRILIVGAYRPEEIALGGPSAGSGQVPATLRQAVPGSAVGSRNVERHPLEPVLVEFKRCFGDMWVDLTQADEAGGRRFVDVFLDTEPNQLGEDFRAALFAHTRGHPLFTVELLRTMQARGNLAQEAHAEGAWVQRSALDWETLPPRVEAVIEARVGRLEKPLREVLAVASVEGERFTAQAVARVQGVAEREMLRTLSQELGPQGHLLVREDGEIQVAGTGRFLARYRFAHALFQEYLYHALSPGERRLLHGEVAMALEELYAGHSDEIAAQLAGHFTEAGQRDKAIDYLVRAGNQARVAYANAEATTHYRRALASLDGLPADASSTKPLGESYKQWRWEALRGLGQICFGVGEVAESEAYLRAAVTLGQEMGLARREIVRLYHWLGEVRWWQGRFEEQIRIGEEGWSLLEDDSESVELALMNEVVSSGHFGAGNLKSFREINHRTAQFLQRLPYVEELKSAHLHVIVASAYFDKNVAEATKWLQILEQKADGHHDLVALQEMHAWAGRILASQGDLCGAVVRHQRALERSTHIGDAKLKSWSLRDMAQAFLALGDLQQAEAHACEALKVADAVGNTLHMAEARWHIGQILLCQGASEEAVDAFQHAAQPVSEKMGYRLGEAHALGRAYLAMGDRGAAIKRFQEILALAAPEQSSRHPLELASALSGLEEAYDDPETFRAFCLRLRKEHPPGNGSPFVQWFLESTRSRCFSRLVFDGFVEPRSSDWVWHDPFGDCSYKVQNGLQINAANGRDLWHINLSAPRVLGPVLQGGDFVVQTVCRPVTGEMPAIGGLLLWKDQENYLRLDRGRWGTQEIAFQGCLGNDDIIVGRGRLETRYPCASVQGQESTTPPQARAARETGRSPGRVVPGMDESSLRVFLRLARIGGRVEALCSADGVKWFTVGSVEFPVQDPVQVGIHAIGSIDRTIYHGAYASGTAIWFGSFQLWQPDH